MIQRHSSLRFLIAVVTICLSSSLTDREAAAQSSLITDISSHLISVTSDFTGTELLLFGAIELDAEDVGPGNGDVLVIVRGPEREVVVRRKDRVAGIWINLEAVEFQRVPSFYALASNRPVEEIAPPDVLQRLRIGPNRLRFQSDKLGEISEPFEEALVRQKTRERLYSDQDAAVYFLGNKLFRTTIAIPANVPVGDYIAEFYLFKDGELLSASSSPLFIKKSGLGRTIYDFAHDFPALYGIAAIIVALIAGWLASAVFRKE
tara:strand:+ start:13579 stop:14364 length:786 start_codon:yes stop_codon:yes gene_type:complete